MKKFLLLWSGELISAIGSGLTAFAIGVYIYQITGKASAMALVTLLAFLPPLLLSPFAGVLADRYDRRLLMIMGDGLSAVGLLYILFCMWDGEAVLWQICLGVSVSAVFSALLEPAYKATVTDLLSEEEYSKASGLVQMAGSSRYLISPLLAGFLLSVGDIKLILMLDISTFILTVIATLVVRNGLKATAANAAKDSLNDQTENGLANSFLADFTDGIRTIGATQGAWTLIMITTFITFFLAFIQTLAAPMMLAFSNSATLGIGETISAMGMLVTSLLIGFISIKKGYVKTLSVSLFLAGMFMMGFGCRENIFVIAPFGFLFFAMLPFANMSADCLIRKSIPNEKQGRAWGVIGVVSQMGYVVAYAICGVLADYIFTPWLMPGGMLADTLGRVIGVGSGRGTGFLIMVAGLSLSVLGIVTYNLKKLHRLEEHTCF